MLIRYNYVLVLQEEKPKKAPAKRGRKPKAQKENGEDEAPTKRKKYFMVFEFEFLVRMNC